MMFFGPKKLPELGRGLGEAIRGFKDGLDGGHKDPKPDDAKPVPRQEP
jgi:sec-independent protein translocase protein TatA